MERRRFLSEVAAAGALPFFTQPNLVSAEQSAQELDWPAKALPRTSSPGLLRGDMLYRDLGQTGVSVSAIGMGRSHIAKPSLQGWEARHRKCISLLRKMPVSEASLLKRR